MKKINKLPNQQTLSIMTTQIILATEFNELTIIISLDYEPTLSEQNDLFSINVDAVVLEF